MNMRKKLLIVLMLVFILSMIGCTNGANDSESGIKESVFTGEYIVDANYAKKQVEDGNAILLDARGEETAKKGTIEGAVATNWQNLSNVESVEKGDYDWGLILEPEVLSKKLGDLGLSKDKEIILFAEGPKGWGEDKEYNGGVHYREAKGGRLPGAIQVKFTDLFDSDGYLKSNEDIISMFEDADIKKDDKVVTYCTSGIRSAYEQLILEMLDYEVVKNYDGSYNTWCVHNEVEND